MRCTMDRYGNDLMFALVTCGYYSHMGQITTTSVEDETLFSPQLLNERVIASPTPQRIRIVMSFETFIRQHPTGLHFANVSHLIDKSTELSSMLFLRDTNRA